MSKILVHKLSVIGFRRILCSWYAKHDL